MATKAIEGGTMKRRIRKVLTRRSEVLAFVEPMRNTDELWEGVLDGSVNTRATVLAQRPELWRLYNTRKNPGESIRVFPISNWTELDVWQYIHLENIPIVPLYFAKERPVVDRDGQLIMIDDDRYPLRDGEQPQIMDVRFRTLGCYPRSSAQAGAVAGRDGHLTHCCTLLLHCRSGWSWQLDNSTA